MLFIFDLDSNNKTKKQDYCNLEIASCIIMTGMKLSAAVIENRVDFKNTNKYVGGGIRNSEIFLWNNFNKTSPDLFAETLPDDTDLSFFFHHNHIQKGIVD